MKDIEIKKEYNIPLSTLQDWKKADKDNWRKKVYDLLQSQIPKDKEEQKCKN